MTDKRLLKVNVDRSFLGNARYPDRKLRHRAQEKPIPGWSWHDRSIVSSPFTRREFFGTSLSSIDDVNNGFFWSHVRKDAQGRLVPKHSNRQSALGGVSEDFVKGVLKLGNVGSGLMIQRRTFEPVCQGSFKPEWVLDKLTSDNKRRYEGRVGITGAHTSDVPSFKSHVLTPKNELDLLGQFAIGETAPTKSASNLGVALAELREGLPSVPGRDFSRNPSMSAAGGEYLNYQFGIAPTINDIKEVSKAIRNSRAILEQFERDSERLVRRRFQFPDDRQETTWSNVRLRTGSAVTNASIINGNVSETKTTKRWFVGAFRYKLPGGSSALDRLKHFESEANKLLGLRLTPEMIWQLTPWSWMCDWFVNLGDIIHNVSLFSRDGLVLQYGYVMEHIITERVYVAQDALKLNSYPIISKETFETKRRLPATPYGFGVDMDALSEYQWSILVALGLSRGKSKPPQV